MSIDYDLERPCFTETEINNIMDSISVAEETIADMLSNGFVECDGNKITNPFKDKINQ